MEIRSSGGTALAIYTATYDVAANRTGVVELDGTCVTYSYDRASQLVNEWCSGASAFNTTYQYDPTGNRVLKNDSGQRTTYSYNAVSEMTLVTPASGQPTTVTWDARGNCLVENAGGTRTTYTWEYENRLSKIAYTGGAIDTHVYSAEGKRRRKVTSGGTANFLWDGENVLLEADASVVTQAQYTDFPGVWGGLASQRRSSVSSFFGFDLRGNTRMLVSAGGAITDSYAYKAFGDELASSGSTTNPYRYCGLAGYYRDTSDREYVRARHLSVGAGRWMSRDPLGWTGVDVHRAFPLRRVETPLGKEVSWYAYAANSPVQRADPTGLFSERVFYFCKNLNPFEFKVMRGTADDACNRCCDALFDSILGVLTLVANFGRPTSFSSSPIGACETKCVNDCSDRPSGSVAVGSFMACVTVKTGIGKFKGKILDKLLEFYSRAPNFAVYDQWVIAYLKRCFPGRKP